MVCPIQMVKKLEESNALKQNKIMPEALSRYRMNFYGNKKNYLQNILDLIPPNTKTIADLFGGTGIVSWFLKFKGYRIIANDVMRYPALRMKALVKNNSTLLDEGDLRHLCKDNPNRKDYIRRHYLKTFGEDNCRFLDNWAANVETLPDEMKRDIAVYVAIYCIAGHLKYAAVHWGRLGTLTGNQHFLKIDLKTEICQYALDTFPDFIFDNGQANDVFNEDAVGLVDKIQADVLYIDSPYCCRAGAYEGNYTFFDDLVSILSNKGELVDDPFDSKCELEPYTSFDSRSSALTGLAQIIKRSRHIPCIIISYNSTSKIDPDEIVTIAKVYRDDVESHVISDCNLPITQKGRNNRTNEHLIVCREAPAEYNCQTYPRLLTN